MSPGQIVLTNHAHVAHIICIYLYELAPLAFSGYYFPFRFVLFFPFNSLHQLEVRLEYCIVYICTRLGSREKIARVRVIFKIAKYYFVSHDNMFMIHALLLANSFFWKPIRTYKSYNALYIRYVILCYPRC